MDRRKLLYTLTALSAAALAAPRARSSEANGRLRVGLVGVVGAGVYFLHPVARQLGPAYKTIAIETRANQDRLGWCDGENSLLIGGHGEMPRGIEDAQRMGRGRRSDIAKLVSGLDAAFLLTGLNGISGKGLALATAETLGESGIFTVAIVAGRREASAVNSLRQLVSVAIEVPYTWQVAARGQDPFWREHAVAAIARKCRKIALSLV